MSTAPVPEMADCAATCADRLHAADSVLVASHIDADGLTSAAVAGAALERAGVPHGQVFYKQLDADAIGELAATDYDTVLFTDFGSGQLDDIVSYEQRGAFTPIVVDHHQPADAETTYHLNPLLFGIDGARELSGAGATYVLARALEAGGIDNRDLAATAVVGAVGDMQDSEGELTGANAALVEDGISAGALAEGKDLAVYGKQTRPLPKLLEYATDIYVPGISNSYAGAVDFLEGLDVDCRREGDGEWKRWVDLTDDERQRVASALVQHAVKRGVPARKIDRLIATTYTLTAEPEGTELRDASEFSTLLNATARYDRADVGLAVCLGDRTGALETARELLRTHRRNLSEGLDWVKQEGVTDAGNVQWFDAGDAIRETIVGIVAGMSMGTDGVDRSKPVVAFAEESDEETKVSARGTGALVRQGLDLSVVMSEASEAVGGGGGGHDVAAGATIPAGEEAAFIEHADRIVGEQLG